LAATPDSQNHSHLCQHQAFGLDTREIAVQTAYTGEQRAEKSSVMMPSYQSLPITAARTMDKLQGISLDAESFPGPQGKNPAFRRVDNPAASLDSQTNAGRDGTAPPAPGRKAPFLPFPQYLRHMSSEETQNQAAIVGFTRKWRPTDLTDEDQRDCVRDSVAVAPSRARTGRQRQTLVASGLHMLLPKPLEDVVPQRNRSLRRVWRIVQHRERGWDARQHRVLIGTTTFRSTRYRKGQRASSAQLSRAPSTRAPRTTRRPYGGKARRENSIVFSKQS
jgi:hypothetical protein